MTNLTLKKKPSTLQRPTAGRLRIEESAHEAFVRYGYAATTMESIAALAGVSERTVYRHFGSKSALVVRPMREWIHAYVDAVRARALHSCVFDALVEVVDTLELEHLPRQFFEELTKDPGARGAWLAVLAEQQDPIALILREAPSTRIPQVLTSRLCASLVLSALDTGFRMWLDASRSTARPDLQRALRESAAAIRTLTTS